ncbi:hypothetical protein TVAG_349640 [Trichomonas vaginalis G3]|uniref:Uncharacterized protein n=1 Tax=Trichomonas vaginalis (strain ATCC PRA-98 / G3) TaxID=412133 RepID=A2EMP1_TRIV3|nr:ribonuclease inhibitor domain-containing protein [Trichomonas vaginalis G3]EAY06111.1 hypothetical protein TVAG_349640 [Trichomonas vaginalis G3]KAI5497163.1 ribonuclease inhibitor domain-containing protein [Trichomonas vaginalis G3]|eukprot:XP_001318334.1 hypothetical protein [Trichomonas vaginalis G3]
MTWKKKFNQGDQPIIDASSYPYTVFVTNYPQQQSPNAVISFIQSIVQQNLHHDLDIQMKTLWADGISFCLPNQKQYIAALNTMGSQFGNQHLWVIPFPGILKEDSITFSKIFEKNFQNNVMDLSYLFNKLQEESNSNFHFAINIQEHLEYLFYRLGQECKEHNTIIRILKLSNNNITMFNQLDRLLWFLPGLEELDLTKNPLTMPPVAKEFPNIRIMCSIPGSYDPNAKKWKSKSKW